MIPLRDDNPTLHPPYVTVALIALCALAFLWQFSLGVKGQKFVAYSLGVVPAILLGRTEVPPELQVIPAPATILTSMFLHGGWMHLIGNMLYLWIFGNNVEDSMGHGRFTAFYVLCGAVAVLGHALPHPESTIPMIGASGAISGFLGAYLLLFPHARVLVVMPLGFFLHAVRLPAMVVLGFWFLLQLINSAVADPRTGGVAWGAHIGGFLAGLALIPFFKRKNVRFFAPPRGRR